jgi:hypothetical protein
MFPWIAGCVKVVFPDPSVSVTRMRRPYEKTPYDKDPAIVARPFSPTAARYNRC